MLEGPFYSKAGILGESKTKICEDLMNTLDTTDKCFFFFFSLMPNCWKSHHSVFRAAFQLCTLKWAVMSLRVYNSLSNGCIDIAVLLKILLMGEGDLILMC